MSDPTFNDHLARMRELLGSRPEQGWVFGVCGVLARRCGWDLWAVRLVAIALTLIFPLFMALAYLGSAMVLEETRADTQRRLSRWAAKADELIAKFWRGLQQLHREHQDNSQRRHGH